MAEIADQGGLPLFRYVATNRVTGASVTDTIRAASERDAARSLAGDGLIVTSLKPVTARSKRRLGRDLKLSERVLVIRQLSLMVLAGVSLLEAVETVAAGIESEKGRQQMLSVADALRQGAPLGTALETHAPGYPFYVYALTRVGEASGRIGEVLQQSADQMDYEDRLRRDFSNAMAYPAFLGVAGVGAIGFIFLQVVPRFSTMIGDEIENAPFLSRAVIATGNYASEHVWLLLAVLVGLTAGVMWLLRNPASRTAAYDAARLIPLVGPVLQAREITAWARLTAFALANGVQLLDAAALSRQATPPGALRRGLERFEADLRSGAAIDQSLGQHTDLTLMDLSLLRTGQRSGALPRMFGFLADSYDAKLRDLMKRVTALVEPLAVGAISIIVGVVAVSLVLALTSVYDAVG